MRWTQLISLWSWLALLAITQLHPVSCLTANACGPGPHNVSNLTFDVYQKAEQSVEVLKFYKSPYSFWILNYADNRKQRIAKKKFPKNAKDLTNSFIVKRMKQQFENISVRYDIKLANFTGEIMEQTAVFKLWERPKLKWSTPKSHTLRLLEGDTLPEMCFNVIAGKPQPVVDILKLNNSQQSTEHPVKMHSKQNSSSVCLMSPPLSFKDSGDYSLVARNCLPPPSPPLNFTIQVQPYEMPRIAFLAVQSEKSVGSNVETILAFIGDDFIIHYIISGGPVSSIIWKHSEQILNQNHHVHYNSTHLYITNLSASDSGQYKVEVLNALGNVSSEVHLIVHGPTSQSTHIKSSESTLSHVTTSTQLLITTESIMFQAASPSEDNQPDPDHALHTIPMPTNKSTKPSDLYESETPCCSSSSKDKSESRLNWWGIVLIVFFILLSVCLLIILICSRHKSLHTLIRDPAKKNNQKRPSDQWHVMYGDNRAPSPTLSEQIDHQNPATEDAQDNPLNLTVFKTFTTHHITPNDSAVFINIVSDDQGELQQATPNFYVFEEEESNFISGLPDVVPVPGLFSCVNPIEAVSDIETCESVEDLPSIINTHTEKPEATIAVNGTSEVQEPQLSNTDEKETSHNEAEHTVVYSKILPPSGSRDDTATESNNGEKLYATVRMDIKKEKKMLNYVELDIGALIPKYK